MTLECNLKAAKSSLGKVTAWVLDGCGSYHRSANVMKYYKGANKTLEIFVKANFKKCIWLATKWGYNLYKVLQMVKPSLIKEAMAVGWKKGDIFERDISWSSGCAEKEEK